MDELTFVGYYKKYKVFCNRDGFLELYKSIGKIKIDETTFQYKNIERIITMATKIDDIKFKKRNKKELIPFENKNQLKLFQDDSQ